MSKKTQEIIKEIQDLQTDMDAKSITAQQLEMERHLAAKNKEAIKWVQLHVAQRVEGVPRGYVSEEQLNQKVDFSLEYLESVPVGIRIKSKKTNLVVPFGNIQSYGYEIA